MNPARIIIDLFYRTATGPRGTRLVFMMVGGTVFITVISLFVALPLLMDKYLGLPKFIPEPLNIYLSVPVMIGGLFFAFWSVYHFLRVRGTPVPFHPPPKLVTDGPYGHARNPMVSGVIIFLFGLGIILRSISFVFVFMPLFVFLAVLELRTIEEPELEKRLGENYAAYKKRVPMFFPRFKLRSKTDGGAS
jgi:protein-S-isoprenylcysteine O-methyltransferase Ste14